MEEYQIHLSQFDANLTLKNYSGATRRAYLGALRQFLAWRDHEGMKGPFTTGQAREYILYRYKQDLKWQTINGDYSSLIKFYREVLGLDWDVKHIPRPRKERSLPPVLGEAEVKKLIESAAEFKHQVFMSLLYGTGLRLDEALSLRLEHIDGQRRQVRVVKGKGAKDRYVELPECLLHLLRQYFRAYRPQVYLFNGKVSGQPWAKRSAQWSIQHARSSAGIERRISPHVLRHCYATHHLEHGTNLIFLKEQLGHNNLRTTAQYIHLCKRYEQQVNHPIAAMQIRYRLQIR